MILRLNKITRLDCMSKTCNLYTVKNTPSGARRDAYTMYYYIEYVVKYDDIDDYHYNSVLEIMCSIMEVLEYNDLSSLDGAIVRAVKSDNSFVNLYKLINDVDNKCLTFKKL